jgi:hypothetical protein
MYKLSTMQEQFEFDAEYLYSSYSGVFSIFKEMEKTEKNCNVRISVA